MIDYLKRLRSPALMAVLAVIGVLDVVVAAELVELIKRDKVAAAALAPYLGWSVFATALNAVVGDPGHRS